MIAEGVKEGTTISLTRRDVAVWVDEAMAKMKEKQQIIKMHGEKWGLSGLLKKRGKGCWGSWEG